MSKKKTAPAHPLIGKKVNYKHNGISSECEIIAVKAGPMLIDTSTFDQPEAKIYGTLKARLKPAGGGLPFWTPPFEYKGEGAGT
ncbi:MAG: hypothetical protein ABL934_03050 [Lysobacteraceae bacterium]